MAAPTYTHKPAPSQPGSGNNLGGQVVDANRVAVQGVASGFVTTDISASPITSPATLSSSTTTLTTPLNAIQVTLANTGATNAMAFSELSSMSTSFVLNAGQSITLNIARMGNIYLKSSSGTTCSFLFELVD